MSPNKTSNLKSKAIDVVTRNLRQRKITYSLTNSPSSKTNIIAPITKTSSSEENEKGFVPEIGSLLRRSSRITSPKTCLTEVDEMKDKQVTLDDSKLPDIPEERPKRIYRKKSVVPVDEVLGPRRRSKPICRLGCCPPGATHNSCLEVEDEYDDEDVDDDSEEEEFIPNKRTYRKQSFGENRARQRKRPKSVCNMANCCDLSSSFVEIDIKLKRRLFRKKQNSFGLTNDTTTNSCPSSPASYLEIDIKKGKRVYRKKGFTEDDSFSASSLKNGSEVSNCISSPIKKEPSSPECGYDVPLKKRPYHRRSLKLSCLKPLEPSVTCPDLNDDNASPLPTLSTPKKRLPKAPHNTPVCAAKNIISSDNSSLPPVQKRGRGRPRKVYEMSDEEEWTCASSTTLSADTDLESQASQSGTSKPRRSRPWEIFDVKQEEEEEEPISEYELMRQRNIQENLQMLRQLFMDSGLDLNEKASEETKTKKPYTRLPLPPPRPKSARIEVRKSTGLLDFSKISRRISLE